MQSVTKAFKMNIVKHIGFSYIIKNTVWINFIND